MAPTAEMALKTLRALETSQSWDPLDLVDTTDENGPVFLKANQKGERSGSGSNTASGKGS